MRKTLARVGNVFLDEEVILGAGALLAALLVVSGRWLGILRKGGLSLFRAH